MVRSRSSRCVKTSAYLRCSTDLSQGGRLLGQHAGRGWQLEWFRRRTTSRCRSGGDGLFVDRGRPELWQVCKKRTFALPYGSSSASRVRRLAISGEHVCAWILHARHGRSLWCRQRRIALVRNGYCRGRSTIYWGSAGASRKVAVAGQKLNPFKAWRYSPKDSSADTSVTGAVLMGLLAARNAGINVPDECIDNALNYMRSMTSIEAGTVGYSNIGFDNSPIRPRRLLVYSLAFSTGKRYDWPELKAVKDFLGSAFGPRGRWARLSRVSALLSSTGTLPS